MCVGLDPHTFDLTSAFCLDPIQFQMFCIQSRLMAFFNFEGFLIFFALLISNMITIAFFSTAPIKARNFSSYLSTGNESIQSPVEPHEIKRNRKFLKRTSFTQKMKGGQDETVDHFFM